MRRWERMREDVEICLLENVRSYLRIIKQRMNALGLLPQGVWFA